MLNFLFQSDSLHCSTIDAVQSKRARVDLAGFSFGIIKIGIEYYGNSLCILEHRFGYFCLYQFIRIYEFPTPLIEVLIQSHFQEQATILFN